MLERASFNHSNNLKNNIPCQKELERVHLDFSKLTIFSIALSLSVIFLH